MIYSLTPFLNELDVLEIRLAELDGVVHHHIIAESTVTYSGDAKPLHLREHWERFAAWHEKMTYVAVDDSPVGQDVRREPRKATDPCDSDRWMREKHQRNALARGLGQHVLADDDVLLLSDVDEIPRPEIFESFAKAAQHGMIARPSLAMHVYRAGWRWGETLPVICRFFSPRTLYEHGTLEAVRLEPGEAIGGHELPGLGWHLAYMGGVAAVSYKLGHAAHHELDTPEINNPSCIGHSIATGADLFGRRDRQAHYAPGSELPPYLIANHERFAHLL